MTLSAGRATTLVASSRPPRPTSRITASAGCSAKARKAAAVVISKKVIGLAGIDALRARQHARPARSRRSACGLAVGAGQLDALVEAHQMRRGVDVHALAGRLQHRLEEGRRRALAVGAGDVDDGRQAAFGIAELGEQRLDAAEREVDQPRMQRLQLGQQFDRSCAWPPLAHRSRADERRARRGADEFVEICGRNRADPAGRPAQTPDAPIRRAISCARRRGRLAWPCASGSRYAARRPRRRLGVDDVAVGRAPGSRWSWPSTALPLRWPCSSAALDLRCAPPPCRGQQAAQPGQRLAQLVAVHDHVDHAVRQQVLGLLEALGQLLADGLLDDARAGEADERAGLGDVHVAQHGIGGA